MREEGSAIDGGLPIGNYTPNGLQSDRFWFLDGRHYTLHGRRLRNGSRFISLIGGSKP